MYLPATQWTSILLHTIFFCCSCSAHAQMSCLDDSGSAVDWFIVYKLPKTTSNRVRQAGYSYYYMDANQPDWTQGQSSLKSRDQAIGYSLQQIYSTLGDKVHVMYSDEPPNRNQSSSAYGHTKGVLAADNKSGFWLVHSVPMFPPPNHYEYPESGTIYGQTFICISLSVANIDLVGKLFQYNRPDFYDSSIPSQFKNILPELNKAVSDYHVTTPPYWMMTSLKSFGGYGFTAFAKCSKFDSDLYEDLVAVKLRASIYVETWDHGTKQENLPSNCSAKYEVFNVMNISFPEGTFSRSQDHSKWAVSTEKSPPFTCVGDINRQLSQFYRGGGTVCLPHTSVRKNFLKIVQQYEKC